MQFRIYEPEQEWKWAQKVVSHLSFIMHVFFFPFRQTYTCLFLTSRRCHSSLLPCCGSLLRVALLPSPATITRFLNRLKTSPPIAAIPALVSCSPPLSARRFVVWICGTCEMSSDKPELESRKAELPRFHNQVMTNSPRAPATHDS